MKAVRGVFPQRTILTLHWDDISPASRRAITARGRRSLTLKTDEA
jgi:hypothetical protein